MENLNFPPVEFCRPDGTETNGIVLQEFAIVLRNIHHFEQIPTGKWLSLLQEKSLIRQKQNRREADRLHNLAAQLAENDELDKAMIHITQALYRCPADDTLAKAILCQKGELLRRQERIQDAIRHLEMCLKIEGERFSFGTYLCLLRCHKATGNARKVRTTLERCSAFLNRWKDEFQRYDSQLKNEPNRHMEDMKKEFDLHANCIPQEMYNDKCFRVEPAVQDDYVEEIDFEPFMGFTTDKKICGASSACSLDIEDKARELVANTDIPEGSIVLVERPLAFHLEFSKVQCYTCHVVQPHVIPCFHCQGVFYCSYQCQRRDAGYHRYECLGHQLLFFPLVNGNLEMRMLIRTLNTLKRVMAVKSSSNYEGPRTANELFEVLLEGREAFADLFNALLVELDYDSFRPEDFDALMIKTEKLLSYIKFDRKIKSLFFAQWKQFDDRQFDIFVGGLLLHFCTLTMTKVHRLSFDIPATEEFVGRIEDFVTIGDDERKEPLKKIILDALERYGNEASSILRASMNTDMLREGVLQHLEVLRGEFEDSKNSNEEPASDDDDSATRLWTRSNVKRLWQSCLDGAGMNAVQRTTFLNHQRERAEDVVDKALLRFFDSYFDYFGEIPMCSKSRSFPNTLRTFYSTAMKFKHSCQPNLFFAMISNGLFVVRARFNISKGEKLTLNHGPHYKNASREKRRDYLRKIYINCDCLECGQIEDHWTRYQRVKCEECLFNAEAPHTCPQCLQIREQSGVMELLIQQLQSIEANLWQSHLPQLIPLSALGRTAGGLQTATASGKRKVELLMFFERIWLMVFVDATNVPLYSNLKEQLSCFADEVIIDSIDGVYVLLQRCKAIIDTLFPEMSVTLAIEYELIVRRVVKYMLPAKFLGLDMRQVHRTIDLSRSMIRHAFVILEGHFLYDDESYRKLMVVEDRLRTLENNIRATEAHDESELFLTLIGALKQTKDPGDDKQKMMRLKRPSREAPKKQSDETQHIVDLKHASQQTKKISLPNGGDSSYVSRDSAKTEYINSPTEGEVNGSVGDDLQLKTDKSTKRKETGAIPKPSRTTKHHRKV
ncbi:uncharacterized protein LOC135704675 isoform X2 [Ochlerotatus camptorhynchus]|uniref:uncharacterized protein LOC135704675 isoform X2 n=1 Tax=Ochlerotatus camptorhynchus TaxID=644619 RepID=UPI0031DD3410